MRKMEGELVRFFGLRGLLNYVILWGARKQKKREGKRLNRRMWNNQRKKKRQKLGENCDVRILLPEKWRMTDGGDTHVEEY